MSKGSCFVWPSTITSTAKVGEWGTLENINTLLLVNWQKCNCGQVQARGVYSSKTPLIQAEGEAGTWLV